RPRTQETPSAWRVRLLGGCEDRLVRLLGGYQDRLVRLLGAVDVQVGAPARPRGRRRHHSRRPGAPTPAGIGARCRRLILDQRLNRRRLAASTSAYWRALESSAMEMFSREVSTCCCVARHSVMSPLNAAEAPPRQEDCRLVR